MADIGISMAKTLLNEFFQILKDSGLFKFFTRFSTAGFSMPFESLFGDLADMFDEFEARRFDSGSQGGGTPDAGLPGSRSAAFIPSLAGSGGSTFNRQQSFNMSINMPRGTPRQQARAVYNELQRMAQMGAI